MSTDLRVADIIDGVTVREMLGVKTRHALLRWRAKPGFPRPMTVTAGGTELWNRRSIERWLEKYDPDK
jgi:hypothetical protein